MRPVGFPGGRLVIGEGLVGTAVADEPATAEVQRPNDWRQCLPSGFRAGDETVMQWFGEPLVDEENRVTTLAVYGRDGLSLPFAYLATRMQQRNEALEQVHAARLACQRSQAQVEQARRRLALAGPHDAEEAGNAERSLLQALEDASRAVLSEADCQRELSDFQSLVLVDEWRLKRAVVLHAFSRKVGETVHRARQVAGVALWSTTAFALHTVLQETRRALDLMARGRPPFPEEPPVQTPWDGRPVFGDGTASSGWFPAEVVHSQASWNAHWTAVERPPLLVAFEAASRNALEQHARIDDEQTLAVMLGFLAMVVVVASACALHRSTMG